MSKVRITITTTIEYKVDPNDYPNCNTLKDMLNADIENAKDDPFIMMDMDEANTKVSGEIVEE